MNEAEDIERDEEDEEDEDEDDSTPSVLAGRAPSPRNVKSQFILAHPELGAAQVVAKALEEGLEIATSTVYSVRAKPRAHAAKTPIAKPKRKARVKPEPKRERAPSRLNTVNTDERDFFDLVIRIGTVRAREYIDVMAAKLAEIVR